MKRGAIRESEFQEIRNSIEAFRLAGDPKRADELQARMDTALSIQSICSHKGYVRSDNIYLDCGDCGKVIQLEK